MLETFFNSVSIYVRDKSQITLCEQRIQGQRKGTNDKMQFMPLSTR